MLSKSDGRHEQSLTVASPPLTRGPTAMLARASMWWAHLWMVAWRDNTMTHTHDYDVFTHTGRGMMLISSYYIRCSYDNNICIFWVNKKHSMDSLCSGLSLCSSHLGFFIIIFHFKTNSQFLFEKLVQYEIYQDDVATTHLHTEDIWSVPFHAQHIMLVYFSSHM